MQSLSPDKEATALESHMEEETHVAMLIKICNEVDADGSGHLTKSQFNHVFQDERLWKLLRSIGITGNQLMSFFHMLIDNDKDKNSLGVEITSFVHGCMRMKGQASSF